MSIIDDYYKATSEFLVWLYKQPTQQCSFDDMKIMLTDLEWNWWNKTGQAEGFLACGRREHTRDLYMILIPTGHECAKVLLGKYGHIKQDAHKSFLRKVKRIM